MPSIQCTECYTAGARVRGCACQGTRPPAAVYLVRCVHVELTRHAASRSLPRKRFCGQRRWRAQSASKRTGSTPAPTHPTHTHTPHHPDPPPTTPQTRRWQPVGGARGERQRGVLQRRHRCWLAGRAAGRAPGLHAGPAWPIVACLPRVSPCGSEVCPSGASFFLTRQGLPPARM